MGMVSMFAHESVALTFGVKVHPIHQGNKNYKKPTKMEATSEVILSSPSPQLPSGGVNETCKSNSISLEKMLKLLISGEMIFKDGRP